MYSISTSWNSALHKNGYDLIEEIKAIGFDTVELSFALTEDVARDILSLVCDSKIKVSSLHNICPLPNEVEADEASPDYYSLASGDEEERSLAIEVAKNTIDFAATLGAKAVVLHTGRVQTRDRTRDLASSIEDARASSALRARMIKEREEKKDGYLDNVIKSLSELISHAKDKRVLLGVENRFYYRELPLREELEVIFNNLKSKTLGYWHDVGHAEVFERLGLGQHKDLLDRFSSRLIGVHLHDIINVISDHKAPGLGTLDFSIVRPYLREDIIRVIEVHQPASAGQIREGVKYLKNILG